MSSLPDISLLMSRAVISCIAGIVSAVCSLVDIPLRVACFFFVNTRCTNPTCGYHLSVSMNWSVPWGRCIESCMHQCLKRLYIYILQSLLTWDVMNQSDHQCLGQWTPRQWGCERFRKDDPFASGDEWLIRYKSSAAYTPANSVSKARVVCNPNPPPKPHFPGP